MSDMSDMSDAVTLRQRQQELLDICDEYVARHLHLPPIRWVAHEMGLPVVAVRALLKSIYDGR